MLEANFVTTEQGSGIVHCAPSHGPDDFNFYLGETADMIRETVSSFAQNEIAPRASEIDKNNDFPSDLWEKMGNLGILGVTVEEKWGRKRLRLFRAYCLCRRN